MCDDGMHSACTCKRSGGWPEGKVQKVHGEVTLTFEFIGYLVHLYSKLQLGIPVVNQGGPQLKILACCIVLIFN